jgi:hypothetical protein
MNRKVFWSVGLLFLLGTVVFGQHIEYNPGSNHGNKFEQLGAILSDPNVYRTASGAPGHLYWQQKADYVIHVEIDDVNQRLIGSETITYTNNSPDKLTYIWLNLDENEHAPEAEKKAFAPSTVGKSSTAQQLEALIGGGKKYGVSIGSVADNAGKPLRYVVNHTMMRVELPGELKPGAKFVFKIDWTFNISNRMKEGGRGGYEFFEEDGNFLYTIAQWYPRVAVYSDYQGWHNKQFTGRGEFAQVFGDFKVHITVPADHVVGATGECRNYPSVLSGAQLARWKAAQQANEPIEVVTLEEARKAMREKSGGKKTWIYEATNVRDFAFVTSRRLVWDAMAVREGVEGNKPMAMSYYGPEAYPLYRKYSTKAVAHTLRVYSRHTIAYPYPVAISVEAANGMEYPMICFNYGRADKDGTYTEAIKYGMISVIIHEVGHNFFPMIVNTDERQWTWMDEGFNSFCQYLAEQEWDKDYPSRRGPPHKIIDYMKLPKDQLEPIMTNSENIVQFGPNAYAKPATALNILRETVMGRELFDYAFKEFARRWAFKHPTPADFFRTMEDASAVDLDWFWRGWFFSTDPVDISIDKMTHFVLMSASPEKVASERKAERERELQTLTRKRNLEANTSYQVDSDTSLLDFYNRWDRFEVSEIEKVLSQKKQEALSPAEKELLKGNYHFYELTFSNKGGLPMPVILEWEFEDGEKELEKLPAYIWRLNEQTVTKAFAKRRKVTSVVLDPYRETADIDEENNYWPRRELPSRFELFRQGAPARGASTGENPMRQARERSKN